MEYLTTDNSQKEIPFWADDINILWNPTYAFELVPTKQMSYNQQMNSISRAIVLLSILGFLTTGNIRIPIICVIIMISIYFVFVHQTTNRKKKEAMEVIFNDENSPVLDRSDIADKVNTLLGGEKLVDNTFDKPTASNLMSNVNLTDYTTNVNKRPAPPAHLESVHNDILQEAEQMVNNSNPTFPNISDKLFYSLGDQLTLEQSMRSYVSNPSTTIPNDQATFLDYCYGGMVSAKEGNRFALANNLIRHQQ